MQAAILSLKFCNELLDHVRIELMNHVRNLHVQYKYKS